MLTADECRTLAEAYPEIRQHEPQDGDWYFVDRETMVVLEGSLANHMTDWHQHPWVPRLDQLLAFAEQKARHALYLHYIRVRPAERAWSCYDEGDGPRYAAVGSSPESAVCAWLLAAKEAHHADH